MARLRPPRPCAVIRSNTRHFLRSRCGAGALRTVHDLWILRRSDRVAAGRERPVRDRRVVVEVAAAHGEVAYGAGSEARGGDHSGEPREVAGEALQGRLGAAAGQGGEGGRCGADVWGQPGEVHDGEVVGFDEGRAGWRDGVKRPPWDCRGGREGNVKREMRNGGDAMGKSGLVEVEVWNDVIWNH